MQDITSSKQFLFNCDIDQLQHICLTSKEHFNQCHYQGFWISKFKKDGLPLFLPYPTTVSQWIKKYKNLKMYLDESVGLFNDVVTDFVSETLNYYLHNTDEDCEEQFHMTRQYLLDRM